MQALILFASVGVIGLIISVFALKTSINNNWDKYRCDPAIIPFAGILRTEGEKSGRQIMQENYAHCTGQQATSIMQIALMPAFAIMNHVSTGTQILSGSFDSWRASLASVVLRIFGLITNAFTRVSEVNAQIAIIFTKIRNLFSKIQAILAVAGMLIITAISTFMSFYNLLMFIMMVIFWILYGLMGFLFFFAPVVFGFLMAILAPNLGMSIRFCFDPNSPVIINNTTLAHVKMCDLNVGDIISFGNRTQKIVAKYVFDCGPKVKMVSIGNIIVSASHLIFDQFNRKWIRAEDHPGATVLHPEDNPSHLICFETTGNTIEILDTHTNQKQIFSDWEGVTTPHLAFNQYETVLESIGTPISTIPTAERNKILASHIHGVSANTIIRMKPSQYENVRFKTADEIHIGDILENGATVTGIVKSTTINNFYVTSDHSIVTAGTIMYQRRDITDKERRRDYDSIRMVGQSPRRCVSTKLAEKYAWLPAIMTPGVFEMNIPGEHRIISLQTTNGIIPIGMKSFIRDLRGTNDISTLEKIEYDIQRQIQHKIIF